MLSFGHWTRNIYCVVDVDASSFKQLLRALERCSPVEQFLNFTIILVMQISDGRSVTYSIIDINNNIILICLLCNDYYTVYNKCFNLKCRIIFLSRKLYTDLFISESKLFSFRKFRFSQLDILALSKIWIHFDRTAWNKRKENKSGSNKNRPWNQALLCPRFSQQYHWLETWITIYSSSGSNKTLHVISHYLHLVRKRTGQPLYSIISYKPLRFEIET